MIIFSRTEAPEPNMFLKAEVKTSRFSWSASLLMEYSKKDDKRKIAQRLCQELQLKPRLQPHTECPASFLHPLFEWTEESVLLIYVTLLKEDFTL